MFTCRTKTAFLFFILILNFLVFPHTILANSVLFQDDFENGLTEKWTIIHGDWGTVEEDGNKWLRSQVPRASSSEIQAGDQSWGNYELSFDFFPHSGVDRNIFFRAQEDRLPCCGVLDLPVSYGLRMFPHGLELQKWLPNSVHIKPTIPGPVPNNIVSNIKIKVLNNNIKIYLNNSLKIDHSDFANTILSGKIALASLTGASESDIWFDNVKVVSIGTLLDLPFHYEGRGQMNDNTKANFQAAFHNRLTAAFDHTFKPGKHTPHTGDEYLPSFCPPGALGIFCYDSHNGTDFSTVGGQDVLPAADGVIVYTSELDGEGNCIEEKAGFGCVIIINHDADLYTFYAHLDQITSVNGIVHLADVIGQMGESGCKNCGEHLHFGVMRPRVGDELLAANMLNEDWDNIVKQIQRPPSPRFRPFCTYHSPNGASFNFVDPSGWDSEDVDPWSLNKELGGCGIDNDFLWKYELE